MQEKGGFSRWLQEFRKKSNLTQPKLAKLAGISVITVKRWEKGIRTPRIEEIQKLCEVLGCSESDLLNGPAQDSWELKILMRKEGVIDMTEKKSSAVLNIGDDAMAITLSAGYELWEDDTKFEELIEQLRRKRAIGLKTRKEDW